MLLHIGKFIYNVYVNMYIYYIFFTACYTLIMLQHEHKHLREKIFRYNFKVTVA